LKRQAQKQSIPNPPVTSGLMDTEESL